MNAGLEQEYTVNAGVGQQATVKVVRHSECRCRTMRHSELCKSRTHLLQQSNGGTVSVSVAADQEFGRISSVHLQPRESDTLHAL